MRLPWRRSRALHEQLMQEAGLGPQAAPAEEQAGGWGDEPADGWGFDAAASPPPDVLGQPAPTLGPPAAHHGVPRQRGEWDAVVTAEAPGLEGDVLDFLALDGGNVFTEDALPRGDLGPLANAVEERLSPPYRAHAVRQERDLWAVSARHIRIESFRAPGNEIDLTVGGGERTLRVDGRETMADVPGLEALAQGEGAAFHARAIRVEGDLWEVEVSRL